MQVTDYDILVLWAQALCRVMQSSITLMIMMGPSNLSSCWRERPLKHFRKGVNCSSQFILMCGTELITLRLLKVRESINVYKVNMWLLLER